MSEKITSADIRQAMLAKFAPPEWAIMWEVGDSTGAMQKRWADAVMMSVWPSRGLELHGVEIKVSASDWKREAADPRKAEAVGQYCDRWWVHTPPGVVKDLAEVPPAWGLREWDGKRWSTKREAEKNPTPTPMSRGFLAALLRRADVDERSRIDRQARVISESARAAVQTERENMQAQIAAAVEQRTKRLAAAAEQIKAFEEAAGLSLASVYGTGPERAREIGLVVKAVMQAGVMESWGGLVGLSRSIGEMSERMKLVISECGLPVPVKDKAA
jgi:hypothetical protein